MPRVAELEGGTAPCACHSMGKLRTALPRYSESVGMGAPKLTPAMTPPSENSAMTMKTTEAINCHGKTM